MKQNIAAAFGRLCVETHYQPTFQQQEQAAAFGRLCVETVYERNAIHFHLCSRLRAAVC